jgi:hypothetical protein
MPRRPRFPASHGASHGAPYSCVALCAFALSAAALCRLLQSRRDVLRLYQYFAQQHAQLLRPNLKVRPASTPAL